MSVFGKVLAVLNVLAVLGFGYLATMSYSQRAQWAYTAFRYDLAMKGIPVDKTEEDSNGNLRYEEITEGVRKDLGITVQTQEEAAEKLVSQAQTLLSQQGGQETATQKQIRLMLYLAGNASERESLLQLYNYEATPANQRAQDPQMEALKQGLPSLIDTRLTHFRALPQDAKKQEIAYLYATLMDLLTVDSQTGQPVADPSNSSYATEMRKIVGVQEAAQAMSRKAAVLADMTYHLQTQIRPMARERFVEFHSDLLRHLLQQERGYRDLQRQFTFKEAQAIEGEKRAKAQADNVDRRSKELAAGHKVTEGLLVDLTKEQQRLFDTLKQLRDVNALNQRLEKEIRRLENQLR